MKPVIQVVALLFVMSFLSEAEVQSGIGSLCNPSCGMGKPPAIDFSLMNDSCGTLPAACPLNDTDVIISGMTLRAKYGIQPDSALDTLAQRLYQQKGIMLSDRGAVVKLFDTLFMHEYVHARASRYLQSVKLAKGTFYIRTSEGRYAVLVIFDQYIGGIDRYYYYWAYQSDGSRILYKGAAPRAKFDSVLVDPHIFSGRVDPSFVLHDSDNVAAVKTVIDSLSLKTAAIGVAVNGSPLWWQGMRVVYRQPVYSSMLYSPIEAGHDTIAVLYPDKTMAIADRGNSFEQWIADLLVKEDPVSIKGADTIEAALLFKTRRFSTAIATMPGACDRKKEYCRPASDGNAVDLFLPSSARISVEVFDIRGRLVSRIVRGVVRSGYTRIVLPESNRSHGVKFVRVGREDGSAALPFIYLK
jgi:hypothetical protein